MNLESWPETPLQKILCFAGICLLGILISSLTFFIFVRPKQVQVDVDKTPPSFSASRSFDTTREFVTQFPKRLFGSLESRQSSGYLTDRLTEMGYEAEHINFDGRIGGGQQAGRNVLAYKQGETDEIIAVTAHYDTARPTVQGAAKNGAAVGVLMELAELFAEENTRRSLLFAFTDGGEWGATGAKDLCLNYEKKGRITAVLTLDYVAPGDIAGFRLDTIGQWHKSTPPGIRKLAEDVIKEQTRFIPARSRVTEFMEKVFEISGSEQRPFLEMRVPAINLGSFSTDEKREKAVLHSPEDTIENLKIETIDNYGRVAEQIVRSLAESPEIPRLSPRPGAMTFYARTVGAARSFFLLSVFILFFYQIKNSRKVLNLAQISRELTAFFATWIPFLLLFTGIRLAHAARQFPFYDLYPAIAKDTVMQNPPWKVFAIIAAGVLFAAIAIFMIARYFLREWTKPDYRNSCAVLCSVLFVAVFLAVSNNPFWVAAFFTAPCVLWSMLQNGESGKPVFGKSILNISLIAAAAVPACIAFWWLASRLGFGWNFFWYQTLALTTGLFSPFAYFIGTAAIAVGIRFMVISQSDWQ